MKEKQVTIGYEGERSRSRQRSRLSSRGKGISGVYVVVLASGRLIE